MASKKSQRFPRLDWSIMGVTLLLWGIGILNLFSATMNGSSPSQTPIYVKQALFFLMGIFLAAAVVALDYRRWLDYAYVLYGIIVLLLATVLLFGKTISGSQRWISMGPLTFQPSELSKWVTLLVLVRFFRKRPSLDGYYTLREVMGPLGLIGVLAFLIVVEPDLGTTIILVLIAGSVLLCAGFRLRSFLKIALLLVVAFPLVWHGLEDYQRNRIMTFLDPQRDPLGAGYHVTQSKIAVGSGGLFGKGFRQGTQSQLRFLPEHHTDFAFSVWAEEWGFVGSLLLLTLFFLLLAYGMHVAYRAGDLEGRLLALGVVAFFFWPVVINTGMALGLLPVVGVALPFISYGGSSLITSLMAIGLLLNVRIRRFMF
jgi:rod shape determining protein RodA